jgi:hypothetical protein
MHVPWPARQYERTCADRGCSWRVPRQFARKHIQALRPRNAGHGVLASPDAMIGPDASIYKDEADLQVHDRRVETIEAYRTCPKCSSQHFSQRPVRS